MTLGYPQIRIVSHVKKVTLYKSSKLLIHVIKLLVIKHRGLSLSSRQAQVWFVNTWTWIIWFSSDFLLTFSSKSSSCLVTLGEEVMVDRIRKKQVYKRLLNNITISCHESRFFFCILKSLSHICFMHLITCYLNLYISILFSWLSYILVLYNE